MNRILVPVVGVGVVFVIAQGWLTTLWQNIYNLAHGGGTTTVPGDVGPNASGQAFPGSSDNPIVSLILGGITHTGGSDLAQGNGISVAGTYQQSTNQFAINNSPYIIPCEPNRGPACVIPPGLTAQIQQLIKNNGKVGQS